MKSLLAALWFAATLAAQNYGFTKIASTGPGDPFTEVTPLAISPTGVALFHGKNKNGRTELYKFVDGALKKLTDDGSAVNYFGKGAINASGQVVISALLDDASAAILLVADDGTLTTVYRGSGNAIFNGITAPVAVNAAGDVAFIPDFGIGGESVAIWSKGQLRIAAQSTGALAGFLLQGIEINDSGRVAFAAGDMFGLQLGGIYTGGDTPLTRQVPESATMKLFAPSNRPSINNGGAIAFLSQVSGLPTIMVFEQGRTRTVAASTLAAVAGTDQSALRALGNPSINSRGDVVFMGFRGTSAQQTNGLYNGPSSAANRVIATGDLLFGTAVGRIDEPLHKMLDEQGQVLFRYLYASLEFGLAIATPRAGSAPAAPTVNAAGILNAGSFQAGATSRGAALSIFGANLASALGTPSGPRLPTAINAVSVTINNVPAPLYFVSPGQINIQVPFEIVGNTIELRVSNAAGTSESRSVNLAAASPAIYTLSGTGSGQGVVLHAGTTQLAASTSGLGRPARTGDVLTLYANGLGAVDPPISSGVNSCADGACNAGLSNLTLRRTVVRPVIDVGGIRVPDDQILFSGLAPEFVGLYQVNFRLPAGVRSGGAVPIVIRLGDISSTADVTIAVE